MMPMAVRPIAIPITMRRRNGSPMACRMGEVGYSMIVPLLRGSETSWRSVIPLEWRSGGPRDYRGFRSHAIKLISWEDGFLEAYNLERDPYELENLSAH